MKNRTSPFDELSYALKYFGVGIINTALGFGMIGLLTFVNVNPYWSNTIGFSLGAILSFFSAKFLVFNRRNNSRRQVGRYIFGFFFSFALNLLALGFFRRHVMDYIAQLLAVSVYVVAMYLFMRLWIFRD